MALSKRSSRGLDLVNVFMADVRDGVGVYLSVYLLAVHRWDPARIGIVVALPWVVAIVAQSPIGGFIDRTTKKRLLLVFASAVVALSCFVVVLLPHFVPIAVAQLALGFVQTIFPPCVAAISLGMVGHRAPRHASLFFIVFVPETLPPTTRASGWLGGSVSARPS